MQPDEADEFAHKYLSDNASPEDLKSLAAAVRDAAQDWLLDYEEMLLEREEEAKKRAIEREDANA